MKILFGLVLMCLPLKVLAGSVEEIEKRGKIIMATEGAYAPFNFYEGKKLTGFEVDIAEAVAKEIGWKMEWKIYSFDSLLIGLKQNKYDLVIASHAITPDRQKAVDFSTPHYCSGGVIVSHEGGAKTLKDLKGKTIAVQVGTTYLAKLKKIDGVKEIKTYPKDTDSFQNLLAKRVDALVTDRFLAINALKVHKKRAKLQIGDFILVEKVAMATSKGNKALIAKWNEALKKIVDKGIYQKISQKYFGEDISCK